MWAVKRGLFSFLRIFALHAVCDAADCACDPRHHCISFPVVIWTAGTWSRYLCVADLPCPATGNCPTTRTSHEWDWNCAPAWPLTRTRMQVTWGTTLVSECVQNMEGLRNRHGYNKLWYSECHVTRVRSQFYGTCVRRQLAFGVACETSASSECACSSVVFLSQTVGLGSYCSTSFESRRYFTSLSTDSSVVPLS